MITDDEPLGRKLLMIATGEYVRSDRWKPLDVAAETRVWKDWLTADALGERRFTHVAPGLATNPSRKRLNKVVDPRTALFGPDDALVCYITGHGELTLGKSPAHWLVLADSIPGKAESGFDTPRLLRWLLDSGVEHAIVVIDACHAGAVAEYLDRLREDLPPGWVVIAAASEYQFARLGALTRAVEAFSNTGADNDAQPYLNFWDLLRTLARALPTQNYRHFGLFPDAEHEQLVCLPNRHYRPLAAAAVPLEPANRDMAMAAADFTAHWDPRSRGVADASAAGNYFTGRHALMARLVAAAQGAAGALVVAGTAGCGKSAVLSRLVTLSDHTFRAQYEGDLTRITPAELPAPGDVDVAVLATGKVAGTVLGQLCASFGVADVPGESSADCVDRLRRSRVGRPLATIVVDALDEAADWTGILRDVLAPLAHDDARSFRLIVGVRGSPEDDAFAGTTVRALDASALDADRAPFWSGADLAEHVALRLRAAPPYADLPQQDVDRLAAVVAELAGTSYVLAGLIADGLARSDFVQDPDDPVWRSRAAAGLAEVLAAELADELPDAELRARAVSLLAAAAVSRGSGIPRRRLWPGVAGALDPGGRYYDDQDVAQLLNARVGGYLVRDTEDGATVYRPFHDALRPALKSWLDKHKLRDVTALLTAELTPVVAGRTPVPPAAYLRRHLAEHAAESGDLDVLIGNPHLLRWAYPDHLLPLLPSVTDPTARPIAVVYGTVAHTRHDADATIDDGTLELRLRQAGLVEAADAVGAASSGGFSLIWASTRADSEHRSISVEWPTAVAVCGELSPPVVAVGTADGDVQAFTLNDGRPFGKAPGHAGAVSSVVLGVLLDGTAAVASGGNDGRVQVTRLADGVPLWSNESETGMSCVALAPIPGDALLASGDVEGVVRVQRLADGGPVREWHHRAPVRAVAAAIFTNGRTFVASGDDDGLLLVHDIVSGDLIWRARADDEFEVPIRSLALCELPDGQPALVYAEGDDEGHGGDGAVYRLADSAHLSRTPKDPDGTMGLAVATARDGAAVVVSGSGGGLVHVWRPDSGEQLRPPLQGHDGQVAAVAVASTDDGEPFVVSAGLDEGKLRIWPLYAGSRDAPADAADSPAAIIWAVTTGRMADGTGVVASGDVLGVVRLRKLADGSPVCELRTTRSPVCAVAIGSGDHTMVVAGHEDGSLVVHDVAGGDAPLSLRHDAAVVSVALGRLPDGTAVLVSSDQDATVFVHRLPDGERLFEERLLRRVGSTEYWDGPPPSFRAVAPLPGGAPVILTGEPDGIAAVRRPGAGEPVLTTSHLNKVRMMRVERAPDGRPMLLTADSGAVSVRDLDSGAAVGVPVELPPAYKLQDVSLAGCADGGLAVLAHSATELRRWRLDTGQPDGAALRLEGPIETMAIDGDLVVLAMGTDVLTVSTRGRLFVRPPGLALDGGVGRS